MDEDRYFPLRQRRTLPATYLFAVGPSYARDRFDPWTFVALLTQQISKNMQPGIIFVFLGRYMFRF